MKYYNGKFSGKGNTAIGRMAAYSLNGLNVFRSIPTDVKVSNSDAAVYARKRFATLSKIVKNMTPIISMRTMPQGPGENYRNPATTLNSPAVTVDGSGNVTVDATRFKFSKGGFAGQTAVGAYTSNSDHYDVVWTASTQVGTSPDDTVYIAVTTENAELVATLEEDARSVGSITVDLTGVPVGTVCYAYIFVKSSRSASWSDSEYLGTFTIA